MNDRVEAVLYVISGHVPAQAVKEIEGREILRTHNSHGKEGPCVDLLKLAEDIAGLLNMLDAAPQTAGGG